MVGVCMQWYVKYREMVCMDRFLGSADPER